MTECYECSRLAELVAQNTAMRVKLGTDAPTEKRVAELEAENARLRAKLGEVDG